MSLRCINHVPNRVFFNFQSCMENLKMLTDVGKEKYNSPLLFLSHIYTHTKKPLQSLKYVYNFYIYHYKDYSLEGPSPFKLFLWQHIWYCNSGPEC